MKLLTLSIGLIACVATSDAAVRRYCLVSYEKQIGSSDEFKMEVQFVTGSELNKATTSFNYMPFTNYALLWFGKGEVAILEIGSIAIGVGDEFDNEDFVNLFRITGETEATQVNSESSRTWTIKAKESIRWVDPRAAE